MNRLVRLAIIVLFVLSCTASILFLAIQSASMPKSAIELSARVDVAQKREASRRRDNGRLVVKFLEGRITNCKVHFDGQNPVRYT